jgi:hypothetical protein
METADSDSFNQSETRNGNGGYKERNRIWLANEQEVTIGKQEMDIGGWPGSMLLCLLFKTKEYYVISLYIGLLWNFFMIFTNERSSKKVSVG